MAGAFKTIATKNITRHTAHKSYEVVIVGASGSFGTETDLEVFTYHGAENTGEYGLADTATTNGYNKRDIYSSINTDFYIDHGAYKGQVNQTHSGSLRTLISPLEDIRVISIPHLMIGDGIKPGSVSISYGASVVYSDDSNGNLNKYISGGLIGKYGNVFYEQGLVVHTGETVHFDDCTLNFKNTHVIEEHEYMCNASKHEFNATTNHSVLSNIEDKTMRGFVSSSAWNPYVTTVGLYDDANNLLVVGKLGQPIKKSEKYDTSYVIRFDT